MKKIIGVISLLTVLLVSCEKDELFDSMEQMIDTKSAQLVMDEVSVENIIAEADYETDFYMLAEKGIAAKMRAGKTWNWLNSLRYRFGQCPDVTIDSTETGYPRTITLNYGEGTELKNGRVLSGLIYIYISAEPHTDGFYREVTYESFFVDSIGIDGTTTITYEGDDETERKHTFISNLEIKLPNGIVIEREAERVREWLAGIDTEFDQTDDIIQVTGYVEVRKSDGENYRRQIIVPLIRLGDCRYFVEGVIEILQDGILVATFNYGEGECDKIAYLTKDGETYEIDLSGNRPRIKHQQGNQYGYVKEGNGDGNNGMGNDNGKGNGTGNKDREGNVNENGNGNGNGNG